MRTAAGHPMVVTVKAPASLPRLPAAVEVAAYRIATVHARTGRRRDSGVFMSLSFLYGVRRHRAGHASLAAKQRFDGVGGEVGPVAGAEGPRPPPGLRGEPVGGEDLLDRGPDAELVRVGRQGQAQPPTPRSAGCCGPGPRP